MSRKQRLDQMLVDRGLVESRTRAQALVMAGLVFSGERKLEKPGQQIAADTPLDVRGRDHPWVSRGGIKLAHAIDHFGRQNARAGLFEHGDAIVLPQFPGQLVGPAIHREDMRGPLL